MIRSPIYEPKARAREYGDLAINIYTGCNHGCTYCYARGMKERFTPKGERCAFDCPEPRGDIVESVKRQLAREQITGKLIHLCFLCDPYPADIDTTPTREIIRLIKASGNNVQILTKGGYRAVRDFDLLDSGDWFGVTISCGGLSYGEHAEPNSAHSKERLETLKIAKSMKINTWVSCEPVLDENATYLLIQVCWYIDLFRIGKLNHYPSEINWAAFGAECVRLCTKYGRNYYIKDDLRAEMERSGYNEA